MIFLPAAPAPVVVCVEVAATVITAPAPASPVPALRIPKAFSVGDSVVAKFKNGADWYRGKITRRGAGNTYQVTYDDGDVEDGVQWQRIVTFDVSLHSDFVDTSPSNHPEGGVEGSVVHATTTTTAAAAKPTIRRPGLSIAPTNGLAQWGAERDTPQCASPVSTAHQGQRLEEIRVAQPSPVPLPNNTVQPRLSPRHWRGKSDPSRLRSGAYPVARVFEWYGRALRACHWPAVLAITAN